MTFLGHFYFGITEENPEFTIKPQRAQRRALILKGKTSKFCSSSVHSFGERSIFCALLKLLKITEKNLCVSVVLLF